MTCRRSRYFDYDSLVRGQSPREPGIPARAFAAVARRRRKGKPVLLLVNHSYGGGTEKHVQDLASRVQQDVGVLCLRSTRDAGAFILSFEDDPQAPRLVLSPYRDHAFLSDLLRALPALRIHIHQLFSLPSNTRQLVEDLGVPFDFTVHDYHTLCPRVHLKTRANSYCQEPGPEACTLCLSDWPHRSERNIDIYRRNYTWVYTGAERVICPSLDTARRIKKYHPQARTVVVYHDQLNGFQFSPVSAPCLAAAAPLRIAILGYMTAFKGADTVAACAELAAALGTPLEFWLIGYPDRDLSLSPQAPLHMTGAYEPENLSALLREISPHLIWFPSIVPETYSYTLSESLAAGLPVAVPDIGAFAERVAGRPWTWILPWDLPPSELIVFFTDIRQDYFLKGNSPALPFPSLEMAMARDDDFYRDRYLKPILTLGGR